MPREQRDPADAAPLMRPCDRRRFEAQSAAADDPEIVMAAVGAAFADLYRLTRLGERAAAVGEAAVVSSGVLQLCAIPAASRVQADDKMRFLEIISRWSLSRDPRLTIVLQASRQQERHRWGVDDAGL